MTHMTSSFEDLFDLIQPNGSFDDKKLWEDILFSLTQRRDLQREVRALLVEDALFRKALSGDVRACLFWLKIHLPAVWDCDKRDDFKKYDLSSIVSAEDEILFLNEELRTPEFYEKYKDSFFATAFNLSPPDDY